MVLHDVDVLGSNGKVCKMMSHFSSSLSITIINSSVDKTQCLADQY